MSLFECVPPVSSAMGCFFNDPKVQIEFLRYAAAAVALLFSLTVVQYFLRKSEEKKFVSELNFELRRNFHETYGEFRSNIRLWKNAGKPHNPDGNETIFVSAVRTEGKLEALLSDMAGQKQLSSEETCVLGLYRQGFQTLRETMFGKQGRTVPYNYDMNDYHFFNELTASISRLVVTDRPQPTELEARRNFDAILDIRSKDWTDACREYGENQKWKHALRKVKENRKQDRLSQPNNEV